MSHLLAPFLLQSISFSHLILGEEDVSVRQGLKVRECGWPSSAHHPRELRVPSWATDFSFVHIPPSISPSIPSSKTFIKVLLRAGHML